MLDHKKDSTVVIYTVWWGMHSILFWFHFWIDVVGYKMLDSVWREQVKTTLGRDQIHQVFHYKSHSKQMIVKVRQIIRFPKND